MPRGPSSLSANFMYNGSNQVYSTTAELDYVIKLNQRFTVEAGIQFIFNPKGNSDYVTIVVPTLCAQLEHASSRSWLP